MKMQYGKVGGAGAFGAGGFGAQQSRMMFGKDDEEDEFDDMYGDEDYYDEEGYSDESGMIEAAQYRAQLAKQQ